MRSYAVVALALASCYSPDVTRCHLTCASNGACPSGLACNAQGLCADSPSDNCTASDDAAVDTMSPAMTTVKIHVINPAGNVIVGANVVFSTPEGELLHEVETDESGKVVAEVPVGSTATVIRIDGTNHYASTYLDLWEVAAIVSRFAEPTGEKEVELTWPAPTGANATAYFPYTTCLTSSQNTSALTTAIKISNHCDSYDLTLIAKTSAGLPVRLITLAGRNPIDSPIALTQAQWETIDANDTIATRVMNGPIGTMSVRLSPYRTEELALDSTALVEVDAAPSGDAGMLPFPRQLRPVIAVASRALGGGLGFRTQLYVERLPSYASTVVVDLAMRKFPYLDNARTDIPTKTLGWALSPATVVPPSIVIADLTILRGADTHSWHIIAPGDGITQTTTTGTLVLPDIPGDRAFEPLPSDTITDKVMYLGLPPGTENAVRGRIESHEQRLDIFGISDVSYVFRAVAD
jgi:hypothetical protein